MAVSFLGVIWTKKAYYIQLFCLSQLLLSKERGADAWYCQGQKYLEGNNFLSLPHTSSTFFCICVQRHGTHSTYLHISIFLICLSICLWYSKIWFMQYRQRPPAWQGPGVLMPLQPHSVLVSRRLQRSTQNRTSQEFHGLGQLSIEH